LPRQRWVRRRGWRRRFATDRRCVGRGRWCPDGRGGGRCRSSGRRRSSRGLRLRRGGLVREADHGGHGPEADDERRHARKRNHDRATAESGKNRTAARLNVAFFTRRAITFTERDRIGRRGAAIGRPDRVGRLVPERDAGRSPTMHHSVFVPQVDPFHSLPLAPRRCSEGEGARPLGTIPTAGRPPRRAWLGIPDRPGHRARGSVDAGAVTRRTLRTGDRCAAGERQARRKGDA